jgi:ATP-dependent RNA helicase DHX37/DHR1
VQNICSAFAVLHIDSIFCVTGDGMVLLKAVGAFEYEGGTAQFCKKSGLRLKAMLEIRKLRKQLTSEVNSLVSSGQEVPIDPHMKPPSDEDATLLRQIMLSGLPDRIARKATEESSGDGKTKEELKHAYR